MKRHGASDENERSVSFAEIVLDEWEWRFANDADGRVSPRHGLELAIDLMSAPDRSIVEVRSRSRSWASRWLQRVREPNF